MSAELESLRQARLYKAERKLKVRSASSSVMHNRFLFNSQHSCLHKTRFGSLVDYA